MRTVKGLRNELKNYSHKVQTFLERVYSRYFSEFYDTDVTVTWTLQTTVLRFNDEEDNFVISFGGDFDMDTVTVYKAHVEKCRFMKNFKIDGKRQWWLYSRAVLPGEIKKFNITKRFMDDFIKKHPVPKVGDADRYKVKIDCNNYHVSIETIDLAGDKIIHDDKIFISPLEAEIYDILSKYPYQMGHIQHTHTKYEEYPIMEYYYSVMTFLMIRWFRKSALSVIPKDVIKIIAKELWALRTSDETKDDKIDP